MKIITIVSLLSFIQYLGIIKCSNDKIKKIDDLEINNDLIFFSFNKKNFTNFECNLNDKILSDVSFIKPQIYNNNPVTNIVSVLCLFFQYSEIINNAKFRILIKDQFICHQSKVYRFNKYLRPSFVYKLQSFDDYLIKLEEFIKKILEQKHLKIITVKEMNERIFVIQCTDNVYQLKSFEEYQSNFINCYLDIKIENIVMEIYFRYLKMNSRIPCRQPKVQCNLETSCKCGSKYYLSAIKQILINLIKLLDIMRKLSEIDLKKKITKTQPKYFTLFAKKCCKDDFLEQIAEIILRLKIKSMLKDVMNQTYIFSMYFEEHMESLIELKDMLKESLQNPTKICYNTKLSDKSLDTLITNCFILDI